jgi:hypothetical protein
VLVEIRYPRTGVYVIDLQPLDRDQPLRETGEVHQLVYLVRRNTVYNTVYTSVVDPDPKADQHPERLIRWNTPQTGQSHNLGFAGRTLFDLDPVAGHLLSSPVPAESND